jgi:glycosyltransferase involved in cell wall biosynthesis
MMRIGIFAAMAGRKAGGLESYELNLVRALANADHKNEYRIFCLSEEAAALFGIRQENFRFEPLWPGVRWISFPFVLPVKVRTAELDLLHATFVPPLWGSPDSVFTVHDLGMFTNPEYYHPALRWRMNGLIKKGIEQSRLVVCISDAIRNAVQDHFSVSATRLLTVHHGLDPWFRPPRFEQIAPVVRRYGLRAPYLIFVGQLRPGIKNLVRLLEAFAAFRRVERDALLVLAGRRPYRGRYPMEGFDETLDRLNLRYAVRELGYVALEDLPALYAGAEMLVFPSLCEGFGFPVLEAMACGTPVVASQIPALQEVSGDAALLVNPYSTDEIADGIFRMFHDRQLRETCRAKGLARARTFTWKQAAEKTIAAYRQASGTLESLQALSA